MDNAREILEAVNILSREDKCQTLLGEIESLIDDTHTNPSFYDGSRQPLNSLIRLGRENRAAYDILVALVHSKSREILRIGPGYYKRVLRKRKIRGSKLIQVLAETEAPLGTLAERLRSIQVAWRQQREAYVTARGSRSWREKSVAAREFWATVDAALDAQYRHAQTDRQGPTAERVHAEHHRQSAHLDTLIQTTSVDSLGSMERELPVLTHTGDCWSVSIGGQNGRCTEPLSRSLSLDIVIIKANPRLLRQSTIFIGEASRHSYPKWLRSARKSRAQGGRAPSITSPRTRSRHPGRQADVPGGIGPGASFRSLIVARVGCLDRLMLLRVPTNSLRVLAVYGDHLRRAGESYEAVITTLTGSGVHENAPWAFALRRRLLKGEAEQTTAIWERDADVIGREIGLPPDSEMSRSNMDIGASDDGEPSANTTRSHVITLAEVLRALESRRELDPLEESLHVEVPETVLRNTLPAASTTTTERSEIESERISVPVESDCIASKPKHQNDPAPRHKRGLDKMSDRRLRALIAKGEEEGFLSYSEIVNYLPSWILRREDLDGMVKKIIDMGIEVGSTKRRFSLNRAVSKLRRPDHHTEPDGVRQGAKQLVVGSPKATPASDEQFKRPSTDAGDIAFLQAAGLRPGDAAKILGVSRVTASQCFNGNAMSPELGARAAALKRIIEAALQQGQLPPPRDIPSSKRRTYIGNVVARHRWLAVPG